MRVIVFGSAAIMIVLAATVAARGEWGQISALTLLAAGGACGIAACVLNEVMLIGEAVSLIARSLTELLERETCA